MFQSNKLFLTLLLPLLSLSAFAQSLDGLVRVEVKTNRGCKYVEFDLPTRVVNTQESTVTWSGSCENGFINGPGLVTIDKPDGNHTEITAIYFAGIENGPGSSITKTNKGLIKFEGFYLNGFKVSGKIEVRLNTGNSYTYEGGFKNGKFSGNGKQVFDNGAEISGNFEEGKVQGEGFIKYSEGGTYTGALKDSLPYGNGISKYKNGDIYSGFIQDNKFNGLGKLTTAAGIVFDGSWLNGQLQDGSKKVDKSGNVYVGSYKGVVPKGYGKLIASDNSVYEGNFEDGFPEGKGTLRFSNGDVYSGDFLKGKRTGTGVYKWASGNSFEGSFKDGDFVDYGTHRYINGDQAVGKYESGIMTGRWTITRPNGDIFYAEYQNGVRLSVTPSPNNTAQVQEKKFNEAQKRTATMNCNTYARNMMSGQSPNVMSGPNASLSILSAILEGTRMNMDGQSYFDNCMSGYGY